MKLTYNSQTTQGLATCYLYHEFANNGDYPVIDKETKLTLDSGSMVQSLNETFEALVKLPDRKDLGEDLDKIREAIKELNQLPADSKPSEGIAVADKYDLTFTKGLSQFISDSVKAQAQAAQTQEPAALGFAPQKDGPTYRNIAPSRPVNEPKMTLGDDTSPTDDGDAPPPLALQKALSYSAGFSQGRSQGSAFMGDNYRLTKQRDEARGRVETLQKELSAKSEQVDSKEMELQRALERERKMKNDYKPLTEENTSLRSDLNRSETRLAEKERQLTETRVQVRKLQGKEDGETSEEEAPEPPSPPQVLTLKREKSQQEQALDTTIDVMQNHIEKLELQRSASEQQVAQVEETRRKQGVQLKDLEDVKIKQFDQITKLREELDQAQHTIIQQNKSIKEQQEKLEAAGEAIKINSTPEPRIDYPPDETVIQNLLRAQIEFYFSNYNLKRDKPLLEKMVQESPVAKKGFLSIEEIEKLPKVRQLAPDRTTILQALERSEYLKITPNNAQVGRPNFSEPERQEFPFRRTVFVYGLPADADNSYINKMCSSFGKILKIKFDAGPDTLDRHIGRRLLNKPRVKKIYSTCSKHAELTYTIEHPQRYSQFKCSWCMRTFHTNQGFYHDQDWGNVVCLQCAAKRAESQLGEFNDHRARGIPTLSSELLGDDANRKGLCDYRTALVVFESQRQASKCVYVRSRLGYEACFATHFHHYSKLKKEQVNTYEPSFRLMEKPPDDPIGSEGMLRRANSGLPPGRPGLNRHYSHQPRQLGKRFGHHGRKQGGRPQEGAMMEKLYSEHQYGNNRPRFNNQRGKGRRGGPPGFNSRQPQQLRNYSPHDSGGGVPRPLSLARHASAPAAGAQLRRQGKQKFKQPYKYPKQQRPGVL